MRTERMCTHTHITDITCPAVVQTKADCLCRHSWQQPSTQITQQQPPLLAFALTVWTWGSKHTFSVVETDLVREKGRQVKERGAEAETEGTETEAYRQNTHSTRLAWGLWMLKPSGRQRWGNGGLSEDTLRHIPWFTGLPCSAALSHSCHETVVMSQHHRPSSDTTLPNITKTAKWVGMATQVCCRGKWTQKNG